MTERRPVPDEIRRVWFVAHMRQTWQREIGPGLKNAGRDVGTSRTWNDLEIAADTDGTLAEYLTDVVRPWLTGCLASIESVTAKSGAVEGTP